MSQLFNLARVSTATVGTGTITLGAAVPGCLTFAQAGVLNGVEVSYGISDGANSEVGRGVYTSAGTTLTRNVLRSTGAGNNTAISLSGSAQVFIIAVAEDFTFASIGSGTTTATATGLTVSGGTLSGTTTLPNGGTIASSGSMTVIGGVIRSENDVSNAYVGSNLLAAARQEVTNTNTTDGTSAKLAFMSVNSVGAALRGASIGAVILNHTDGAETADFVVQTTNAGTGQESIRVTAAGLLTFRGATSAFPALKRSSTTLLVRLADDSGDGNLSAGTGTITAANFVGALPVSSLVATATNDNAAAGDLGEFISGSASAVALTSPNVINITSVSLTAGDWDVEGAIKFNFAATTTSTIRAAGITVTTGTMPTTLADGTSWVRVTGNITAGQAPYVLPTGTARISLSGTTTIYLVGGATFATSTCTADGIIKARRVR